MQLKLRYCPSDQIKPINGIIWIQGFIYMYYR